MTRSEKRRKKQQKQIIKLVAMLVTMIVAIVVLVLLLTSGKDNKNEAATTTTTVSATTEAKDTPDETTVPEETTEPETDDYKNPMSNHEVHQGQWALNSLDNTEVGFGYSEANRDANMIPTDWAYYESKWGMYNVDWIQDINSNTIYLTMDVGFANDSTEHIIEILKEKNVKVVFFVTKMFYDECPDIVAKMIEEGHIVGNHSCTHRDMPKLSEAEQTAEIMDLANAVKKDLGYEMKLFRFPEGRFSHKSLALVENLGYKSVFWSYAYGDYSKEQPPVQESYEKAVAHLHPGAIYLLHASSSTNEAFLADFIDAARAKGYEFGKYPLSAN